MKRRLLPLSLVIALLPFVSLVGTTNAHGWFTTGQDASILLSGTDFNNAGYLDAPGDGLLFNYPGNIATDGTRLVLADTWNNRVLIWNTIPTSDEAYDFFMTDTVESWIILTQSPGKSFKGIHLDLRERGPHGMPCIEKCRASQRTPICANNNCRLSLHSSSTIRNPALIS